jgi:hypothetical protein
MEEHDDRGAGTEALSLDAMLAVLKEAIHYSDALLTCCRCRTRPENMTILTFLTHRLAALCEKLVLKFCEGPPTSMRVQDYYLGDNNNDEPEQQQRTVQGQGSPTLSLSLGCYEMDSLVELDVLFRCLSHIQLRALSTLMDKLQRQASGLVNCESVRKKAAATKTQVLTLLQKLVAVPMAE